MVQDGFWQADRRAHRTQDAVAHLDVLFLEAARAARELAAVEGDAVGQRELADVAELGGKSAQVGGLVALAHLAGDSLRQLRPGLHALWRDEAAVHERAHQGIDLGAQAGRGREHALELDELVCLAAGHGQILEGAVAVVLDNGILEVCDNGARDVPLDARAQGSDARLEVLSGDRGGQYAEVAAAAVGDEAVRAVLRGLLELGGKIPDRLVCAHAAEGLVHGVEVVER